VAIDKVYFPRGPNANAGAADRFLYLVGMWPGTDVTTVSESERIDLPEAPTGLINTVDRYMFLLGMYPGTTEVEVAANGAVILNNLVLSGVVI